MSYLKLQVTFSLNFGSLFSVMREYFSVLVWLNLYMVLTKGAYQSAKFQTSDCLDGIAPNLYFDRLLLLEVYKMSAKKVKMTLKSDAKLKKKHDFPHEKIYRCLTVIDWSLTYIFKI